MWYPGITSVDTADWRMGEHETRFQAEGAREAEAGGGEAARRVPGKERLGWGAGWRGWPAGEERVPRAPGASGPHITPSLLSLRDLVNPPATAANVTSD